MQKWFIDILDRLRNKLTSQQFVNRSRTKEKYFIRKGPLGFEKTMKLTLNFNNRSQQTEIDALYEILDAGMPVSKQAYSQARQHIKPQAFKELYEDTVKGYLEPKDFALYQGYMPIAIDGSTVAIDNLPELIEYFGCGGPKASSCTGRISIACDVLRGVILDAGMEPYSVGEHALAREHLEVLSKMELPNPLCIFDRGYASNKLLAQMHEDNFKFLMRTRSTWNMVIAGNTKSGDWASLNFEGKDYPVRVIKVMLPTGEREVLFTNVADLHPDDFKALYFLRWPVETKYDVVKNKLKLENFTGKTVASLLQDFWATMTLANLVAFAKIEADEKIQLAIQGKNLKHSYQANTNLLIGALKDKLILMLTLDDPLERQAIFDYIICRIVQHGKIPIRRGISSHRTSKRQNKKFNFNSKSSI